MKKTLESIIRGAGSFIDLVPRTDFSQHAIRGTDADRIGGSWLMVGNDIRRAITFYGKSKESDSKTIQQR